MPEGRDQGRWGSAQLRPGQEGSCREPKELAGGRWPGRALGSEGRTEEAKEEAQLDKTERKQSGFILRMKFMFQIELSVSKIGNTRKKKLREMKGCLLSPWLRILQKTSESFLEAVEGIA